MLPILIMYGFFSFAFTVAKILLQFVPPIYLIAVRMSIAGILLLTGFYFFGAKQQPTIKKTIWFWCFFSIIHVTIPYLSEFIALSDIAPSCSALIFNLTPFFSAFFSYWFFNERMTPKKWLGFLIGFIGIAWFMHGQICIEAAHVKSYLLSLVATISGALGWVYVRMLLKDGYQALYVNGLAMVLAGIQSYGLAAIFEPNACWPTEHSGIFLFWLFLIIALTNVMYYNMYAYFLKKYTATLLSFMGCIIPLFTALFDWFFLGLGISNQFVVALLIAGSGVYIFYQEELKQGYIQ